MSEERIVLLYRAIWPVLARRLRGLPALGIPRIDPFTVWTGSGKPRQAKLATVLLDTIEFGLRAVTSRRRTRAGNLAPGPDQVLMIAARDGPCPRPAVVLARLAVVGSGNPLKPAERSTADSVGSWVD